MEGRVELRSEQQEWEIGGGESRRSSTGVARHDGSVGERSLQSRHGSLKRKKEKKRKERKKISFLNSGCVWMGPRGAAARSAALQVHVACLGLGPGHGDVQGR